MDIHPKFSTWLSAAKLKPGDEVIRKWWTGVAGFTVDREAVIELTRLARKEPAQPEFEAKFTATIQQSDAAFLPKNRTAMAVLAAARLHTALEADADFTADFAALLITVAFPPTLPHAAYLVDLVALARGFLEQSSRQRANWDYLRTGTTDEEDPTELLRRALAVTAEEANMLWWLFGETSRDTRKRFASLDDGTMALIAGKELADLTTILPGPVAMAAFADRACRIGRPKPAAKADPATVVHGMPEAWRKDYAGQWTARAFLVLCPLSRAITQSLGASAHGWAAQFATTTGWPKGLTIAPAALTQQFYLECLLPRAWEDAQP